MVATSLRALATPIGLTYRLKRGRKTDTKKTKRAKMRAFRNEMRETTERVVAMVTVR